MIKKKKEITLAAVGDIAVVGDYTDMINNKGAEYIFSNIASVLKENDITFGNLECPLSERGVPNLTKINFCGNPKAVRGLKKCGFNILSIANNHIFDYGEDAFCDTINLLERNGIKHVGAGKDLNSARKPVKMQWGDTSAVFLGYSCETTNGQNYARSNSPGVTPLKMDIIEKDLLNIRNTADFVIVSLHWGIEGSLYPEPSQIKISHKIIDCGADLILGHHPHVMQGVERYKKGVIVYSLGNFVFPNIRCILKGEKYFNEWTRENKESFVIKCRLTEGEGASVEIIPFFINSELQPTAYADCEKEIFLKKLDSYSKRITSDSYSVFWKNYRIEEEYSKPLYRRMRKFLSLKKIAGLRIYHMGIAWNMIKKFISAKYLNKKSS